MNSNKSIPAIWLVFLVIVSIVLSCENDRNSNSKSANRETKTENSDSLEIVGDSLIGSWIEIGWINSQTNEFQFFDPNKEGTIIGFYSDHVYLEYYWDYSDHGIFERLNDSIHVYLESNEDKGGRILKLSGDTLITNVLSKRRNTIYKKLDGEMTDFLKSR